MSKDTIIRENSDYIFILDFVNNNINVFVKKLKKSFDKSIKTLLVEKTKKRYLVRYLLEDENEINELSNYYYYDIEHIPNSNNSKNKIKIKINNHIRI